MSKKKWSGLFLLGKIVFIVFALSYSFFSLYRIVTSLAPDFQVFYYSTKNVLMNINPYTAHNVFTIFNYPIITTFLYIPLVFLDYQIAQGVYVSLSYFAVYFIVYLCFHILDKKIKLINYLLIVSFVFMSFPTKFTLGMGQANLIGYMFLLVSYFFYGRKKDFLSGLLLGIAIIQKPILVFMLVFYLLHKSWKVFAGTMMIVITLIAGACLFNRYQFLVYYVLNVSSKLMGSKAAEVYYNQGFLGFISRLIPQLTLRSILSYIFIFSCLIMIFYVSIKKRLTSHQQFVVILTVLPLINPLSWQHHYIILIFPFIYLLIYTHIKNIKWLLVIPYLLVSWNFKNPDYRLPFSFLILSHQFIGGFILLYLLLKEKVKS